MSTTLSVDESSPTPSVGATPHVRLDNVLVGVDLADASVRAALWTARAFAPGSRITLAHVVSIPSPPRFLGESIPAREQLVTNATRGAEARLRELIEHHGLSDARIALGDGDPADLLCLLSASRGADLVVVGDHGERTGVARLLGWTAQRVANEADLPMIVARAIGDPPAPPIRIVAALDDDDDGDLVLAWAGFLGARFGAEITLVHVIPAAFVGAVAVGASDTERNAAVDRVTAAAQRWLNGRAARYRTAAGPIATEVPVGDPAAEILDAARKRGADLVLVGRARHRPGVRSILGSVSSHVMRHSDRNVMIIPAPRRDDS